MQRDHGYTVKHIDMTPQEKAQELYNKYEQLGKDFTRGVSMREFAVQCALIAVDEILESVPQYPLITKGTHHYWTSVKKEIEKL